MPIDVSLIEALHCATFARDDLLRALKSAKAAESAPIKIVADNAVELVRSIERLIDLRAQP